MILAKERLFHEMKHRSFLSFILILLACAAVAQKSDSTILFSSTQNEEMFGLKQSSQKTDTVLDNTHNYYQTGVLGNMGLPSYSLLAQDKTACSTIFNWGQMNNSNDMFNDRQALYFRPSGKIYTKLTGAIGQKQEQYFKLVHSQNIKRVNISLMFNRYSCQGFYLNQKSIADNVLFSSNYQTKNGRWGYNMYFLFNKIKYQLNGGIKGDTLLDYYYTQDKQLVPVNLSGTRQNLRTSSYFISTYARLNKYDSSNFSHFIIYEGNFQGNYWIHATSAGDSSYYGTSYYANPTKPLPDSIIGKTFSNSLLYRVNVSQNKFVLYAGYKNELNDYYQQNKALAITSDTITMNHVARAGISLNLPDHHLAAVAQYAVSGYNKDNYQLNANYLLNIGNNFYFDVNANLSQQKAAQNLLYYYSQHFIWQNNFNDISTQNGTIAFGSVKYKFSVGFFGQQQKGAIYFDTLALPQQYNGSAVNGRAFIRKDLKLWHMHFNNTINFQPENNTDFIRLPKYNIFSQLYYEGKLFKKNLWLQCGLQARYISSFEANAYMPATNQFYVQNSKTYGNYIFADVFISAQIDRFRFFIMGTHVNHGLVFTNGTYILAPGNPMPDRSLKAGLVWLFFD